MCETTGYVNPDNPVNPVKHNLARLTGIRYIALASRIIAWRRGSLDKSRSRSEKNFDPVRTYPPRR